MSMVNLLAGDVGGTKTRLGLFEKAPVPAAGWSRRASSRRSTSPISRR